VFLGRTNVKTVCMDFEFLCHFYAQMEQGFDRLDVFQNGQFVRTVTGRESFQSISFFVTKDEPDHLICVEIMTDNSVAKTGFKMRFLFGYDFGKFSTPWGACTTAPPSWRNPSRWSGLCGIGYHDRTWTCNSTDKFGPGSQTRTRAQAKYEVMLASVLFASNSLLCVFSED